MGVACWAAAPLAQPCTLAALHPGPGGAHAAPQTGRRRQARRRARGAGGPVPPGPAPVRVGGGGGQGGVLVHGMAMCRRRARLRAASHHTAAHNSAHAPPRRMRRAWARPRWWAGAGARRRPATRPRSAGGSGCPSAPQTCQGLSRPGCSTGACRPKGVVQAVAGVPGMQQRCQASSPARTRRCARTRPGPWGTPPPGCLLSPGRWSCARPARPSAWSGRAARHEGGSRVAGGRMPPVSAMCGTALAQLQPGPAPCQPPRHP